MISYDTLISEIERHILLAKSTENTQQLREHLSAIRALCDVGLVQNNGEVAITQQITNVVPSPVKLKEEDGNGTSIFDF